MRSRIEPLTGLFSIQVRKGAMKTWDTAADLRVAVMEAIEEFDLKYNHIIFELDNGDCKVTVCKRRNKTLFTGKSIPEVVHTVHTWCLERAKTSPSPTQQETHSAKSKSIEHSGRKKKYSKENSRPTKNSQRGTKHK